MESTVGQNLDLQFNQLTDYRCTTVYQEKVLGKDTERPELKKLLTSLMNGDQVVVWKLDRLDKVHKCCFYRHKIVFIRSEI